MSNSTLTPKEKLSAYQRWEMNDFQQPGGGAQPKARTSAEEEAAKTRQAYDAAFEAGRAEGMRQAAEKTSLEAQQFAAFIDDLRHQQTDTSAAISDEILGLALAVAQQMTYSALETDREAVLAVIQNALGRVLQPVTQATITLHPADAVLVKEQLGETLAAGNWRVVEDTQIKRGGCKLRTLASELDASIETRWQRITAALGQDTPWLLKK